jgi:hypothetical protein
MKRDDPNTTTEKGTSDMAREAVLIKHFFQKYDALSWLGCLLVPRLLMAIKIFSD